VSGHVADPTSAAIPGATITPEKCDTGAVRTTVTTEAGDYTFVDVSPGIYDIQATHSGFKIAASNSVQLQVQQSLRQDFQLELGQVTQSVTVEATGALLQVADSTLGTVVENEAVTQLPLNGRNYLGLVGLSSNVNTLSPMAGQEGARLGGQRASESISAGGQRIVEAQPGFYGSASRNAVEGPGVINFDAEVHKEFHMPYSENHRLQFRLEAFNALNHANWSMPNLNILSGPPTSGQPATYPHQNFGVINGAGTMRQLQLGAKYLF